MCAVHIAIVSVFVRRETKMTSIIRIALGAAFAVSVFGGAAMAGDASEASIVKSCKWDIVKFAATAKKGEIKAVLVKNIDKLSADCKKAVDAK
jgi:hypothetical protein